MQDLWKLMFLPVKINAENQRRQSNKGCDYLLEQRIKHGFSRSVDFFYLVTWWPLPVDVHYLRVTSTKFDTLEKMKDLGLPLRHKKPLAYVDRTSSSGRD